MSDRPFFRYHDRSEPLHRIYTNAKASSYMWGLATPEPFTKINKGHNIVLHEERRGMIRPHALLSN